MPRVTKSISIKAKADEAIEYIANVKNHPAFISSLKSIENLHGDPKHVGEEWDWIFVMAGVELHGKSQTVTYEESKQYAFKTNGSIDSTFTYTVEPEDDGIRLTLDVDYEIPQNVLGAVADATVVERLNEKEGDSVVQNLQAILGS